MRKTSLTFLYGCATLLTEYGQLLTQLGHDLEHFCTQRLRAV